MRIKTRSGFYTSIPNDSIISQEKRITRHEIYYVLYLHDGRTLSVSEPVDGLACKEIDERKKVEEIKPITAPTYERKQLLAAADCPSAGGAMCAVRPTDEFAHEKVKGETFFTHKTSPGLVIKSPKGDIVHETKMSDMYKRRDS